jgi:magnesium chelatase subunit I
LEEAQNQLTRVDLNYENRICISQLCAELNVDGLRGDIVTNRAARSLAAFENRLEATQEDVIRVASLCLRHRLRKDPLENIDSGLKVRETWSHLFS